MALSCGGKTLKYTLFAFNFIFWLTGVSLIVLGLLILLDSSSSTYLHVGPIGYDLIKAAAIAVTVVGVLIFVVSGLGCCGACTESKACLNGFAVFLAFIVLLQLISIILAGALHSMIEKELRKEMNGTLHRFENDSVITHGWNFMQIEMKCCGIHNLTDWGSWYHNPDYANATVPASCCVQLNTTGNYSHPIPTYPDQCYNAAKSNETDSDYVYRQGCYEGLQNWFISKVGIFIAVVSVIIFIQMLVVILSCVLKKKITAYEYV